MGSNNIEFFNLVDGQSAVIRILATSVSKIERVAVHTIDTNNQGRKKVKCLEDSNLLGKRVVTSI